MIWENLHFNGKEQTFSTEKQAAVKDWLIGFKVWRPQLSLNKPEPTSRLGQQPLTSLILLIFILLIRVVDTHKLTADRIYNCDESGITVVPKHKSIILLLKYRKKVSVQSSAEWGHATQLALKCVLMLLVSICPRCLYFQELELTTSSWMIVHLGNGLLSFQVVGCSHIFFHIV